MSIVYFKDRFIEESECHIPLGDRSFRFGDGVFETLLVARGEIYDMHSHLERLRSGLEAFRFGNLALETLPGICAELVQRNTLSQGLVRIIVSRGVDADSAGYLPRGSAPYMVVQAFARPYPAFTPICLWQSSVRPGLHSPSKTNNALPYVLAMLEAADHACDNALLQDAEGHICETASGNIFWISDDTLYTPVTTLPFVPGTMRSRVLELWGGKVTQGKFTIEALHSAEEMFMTNSGVIIAPVVRVDPVGINLSVGARTKALRALLDSAVCGNTQAGA